jgi:hypothetical protein
MVELKAILIGEKALDEKWFSHINVLFNEIPHKDIAGAMMEWNISFSDLKNVYNALPPVLRSKPFEEFKYNDFLHTATTTIDKTTPWLL